MTINWFPGHMSTARREIRDAMPEVDLVIEVLDARLPFSSENPLVAPIRGDKPCIQVLNKADLADPAATEAWMAHLAAKPGVHPLTRQLDTPNFPASVARLAYAIAKPHSGRPLLAMILGIPNVGKSTLINVLAGRNIAKTGNKPAVTQMQQRIRVNNNFMLLDTPGFLWPKLAPAACGYRLAASGAIADRVIDAQDIANFAARFLLERYPAQVQAAYGFAEMPATPEALVEAIGRKRGQLMKGGVVDPQRAAERLLYDLRGGLLGRVSLERPDDIPAESAPESAGA